MQIHLRPPGRPPERTPRLHVFVVNRVHLEHCVCHSQVCWDTCTDKLKRPRDCVGLVALVLFRRRWGLAAHGGNSFLLSLATVPALFPVILPVGWKAVMEGPVG